MNTKIEMLIDNAKLTPVAEMFEYNLVTFAQSIVNECCDVIIEAGTQPLDFMPSKSGVKPEYYEMADLLREHFKSE